MDIKKAIDFTLQFEQQYESPARVDGEPFLPILCSECFADEGLKLVSQMLGFLLEQPCPNCGRVAGAKLDLLAAKLVIQRFFNTGTMQRLTYGGAPVLVSNPLKPTSVKLSKWSGDDISILSEKTGWGIFSYGPRLWMVGEVEPLKKLVAPETRQAILDRIASEYPTRQIVEGDHFYRIRSNVSDPAVPSEYDSPPSEYCGSGRLDSSNLPVLYGSQDLQVCIHECRTTVDDDTYVATLTPTRSLRLLNLAYVLRESGINEFQSLDIAVHMLFLAKSHSYEISRELARTAHQRDFDGIIYPSYFSMLRTGAQPFETIFGISVRHVPDLDRYATAQIISNVALFGRPLTEGKLKVKSINRVIVQRAEYALTFGPVGYEQC